LGHVNDSEAYFTGVYPVKQPAGLPDEDRGFTGVLFACRRYRMRCPAAPADGAGVA